MQTTFNSALGSLTLERLPLPSPKELRAWDAADEILLEHLLAEDLLSTSKNILVINDNFGALAACLSLSQRHSIAHWGDSFISQLSLAHNLQLNSLSLPIQYYSSLQQPEGSYDLILIKLPKVTALLETQVNGLCKLLNSQAIVIAAGMCKHMPTSVYKVFERYIGSTHTSRAVKKARLIFPKNEHIATQPLPYPMLYQEPSLNLKLSNHANVFSKESLDIGARFFISQFRHLPEIETLIDLGCGNGVLGIMAKKHKPDSCIHFVDESFMAIASATTNYQLAYSNLDQAHFHHSECLSQLKAIQADLILCNPPFHQQHNVGDFIAKRMFVQSHQLLNNQGELWVVANRHLAYYSYLKNLFGNCSTIASNNKFDIFRVIKRSN